MGGVSGTLTLIIGLLVIAISVNLPAYYSFSESFIVTLSGIMMILTAIILYMKND